MSIARIAVNAAMFASLIRIKGVVHWDIGTCYLVNHRLRKYGNISGLAIFSGLPYFGTVFKEGIEILVVKCVKTVYGVFLGTPSSYIAFFVHIIGFNPNIWIISNFRYAWKGYLRFGEIGDF
jgi:hypothetical protein